MNKFFVLTSVLLKNSSVFQKTGNKRRNLGLLVVVIALLPMMVTTTLLLMKGYDVLKAVNLEGVILASLLSAACISMIVFGILYVISIYYFSDDIIQLITLPIRPPVILASKFVIVTIYQYALEALILLPCIIAFGIKIGSAAFWIYSIVVFLALPALPTVICSVISLLLMAFGKFFRNKDRVKFITGFLAIVAAVGINVAIQAMGVNSASGSNPLLSNSGLMKQAAMAFPTNFIAVNAMMNPSALQGLLLLVLFLLISAVAVALFLLLGNGLYLSGVIGLTQSTVSGKRISNEQFENYSKKRSGVLALAMKDWRILYRTPSYFLNCILSAIIFPPLMIVIFGFSAKSLPPMQASPLVISIGVIIVGFLCIMNMASPTAVSREGKDSYFSKFIPVPYRLQVISKLLPGLFLSFVALVITLVLTVFLFKIEPFALIAIFVISLISIAAFNMLGLFVDILFPKLDWDDETAAVKRNMNVGIQMIVMIVVLALFAFLVNLLKLNLYAGTVFLLLANVLLLVASAVLLFTKGVALYSDAAKIEATGAKKKKDPRKMITAAVTIIGVVAFAGFMFWEFTAKTNVQVTSTKVEISAGFMESSSFDPTQIKTVYLKDSMPATSNRSGYGAGNELRGTFTVAGLGRGHVYTQTDKGPFLYVILNDGSFTILNYSDSVVTQNLYQSLSKYAKQS